MTETKTAVTREAISTALETLDAAAFAWHGDHAPEESWMLCGDRLCQRRLAAAGTLRIALAAQAPAQDASHVWYGGRGVATGGNVPERVPAQEERLDSRHMTAFEKAAALERDRQWEQMQPSDLVPQWSRERLADAYFMACYDRRGLLNELGWRALGDESKEEGS